MTPMKLMNGHSKLECYITLGWKGLQGQTVKLIWPICKLRRRWSDVNTVPGQEKVYSLKF
jgi:hypothetical protein